MNHKNAGHTGAFPMGLFIGGLVGVTAALLLVPQSGEETREQVRKKAVKLQEKAVGALTDARAKAETAASDMKQRAEELQAKATVALEEGPKQLAKAMEETKKAAASASTGAAVESAIEISEKSEDRPAKA